jgi:hypothetical protein
MYFSDKIHETQITRNLFQPFEAFLPAARRSLTAEQRQRAIARAAVREVLG